MSMTDGRRDARLGKVTGSRVGAILGVSEFQTRHDVMREMVREVCGVSREFTGNEATRHGNRCEAVAISDFEDRHGVQVEDMPADQVVTSPENPRLTCSPDGIIDRQQDGRIIRGLEVKAPYWAEKPYGLKGKPGYYAQCCFNLIVTQADRWDFTCWLEDGWRDEYVTRSEAEKWWQKAQPEVLAFIDEFDAIIADPERCQEYLEPAEIDADKCEEWQGLVACYDNAKASQKAAEKRVKAIKGDMVEYADRNGGKKVVGAGRTLYPTNRGEKTIWVVK